MFGLQAGSPAIDAGSPSVCPSTDQRGTIRPIDGDKDSTSICDMGAFEFNFESYLFLPLIIR